MIGHRSRLRENEDLPLWRGSAVKKKPPFSDARALITRKIMRSSSVNYKNYTNYKNYRTKELHVVFSILPFGNHLKKFGSNFNQGFSFLSKSRLKMFICDRHNVLTVV